MGLMQVQLGGGVWGHFAMADRCAVAGADPARKSRGAISSSHELRHAVKFLFIICFIVLPSYIKLRQFADVLVSTRVVC